MGGVVGFAEDGVNPLATFPARTKRRSVAEPLDIPAPPRDSAKRSEETRTLGLLAIAAIVVLAIVAHEVAVGILLGALTAFILEPLYPRLSRTRSRWIAQMVCLGVAAGSSCSRRRHSCAGRDCRR